MLAAAPSIEEVDSRMLKKADWRNSARAAKGQNVWNDAWEKGVEDSIDAFSLADHSYRELDKFINIYDRILRDEEKDGKVRKLEEEVERLRKLAGESTPHTDSMP